MSEAAEAAPTQEATTTEPTQTPSEAPSEASEQRADPVLEAVAAMEAAGKQEEQREAEIIAAADAAIAEPPKEEAPKEEAKEEPKEAPKEEPKEEPKEAASAEEAEAKTEAETQAEAGKPLSKNWAAIAKAEKKNRETAQQLKQQQEQYNSNIEQIKNLVAKAQQIEASTKDPVAWAAQNLTPQQFESLAQRVIDGEKLGQKTQPAAPQENPEITQMRQRMEALEQARNQDATTRAVQDYRSQINNVLEEEDNAILKHWPNVSDEIITLASNYAAQNGEVLTAKDAAGSIRETLVESIRAVHEQAPGVIPAILGLEVSASPKQTDGSAKATPAQSKTLTNELSSQTAPDLSESEISEEDAIRAAAKLISQMGMSDD